MLRLKQDIDKLREILLASPKSWGELRQSTGWVNSVLKQRIDFLENLGELTTIMGKRKGRRTPLYTLSNEEKSRAKRAKYAAIEFIERMGTPVYAYAEKEKTKIIGGLWIFAALINFVLNILIIPYWGISGAAITTIIAYSIAMILVVYFSFKEFKFRIDWIFIIKSIAASAIMALVISRINPSNLLSIVMTVFTGIIIYTVALFVLQGIKRGEYLFFKKLVWNSAPP